jgi:DNA-binding beta-propeller fold protein YncE
VTLSTSIVYPNGIAVDSAGTVYVTSGSTVGQCYVLEFPKGSSSPSAQVNGLGLPIGLAIDKDDNLYIGDAHTNDVYEVPKGTTTATNLGLSGLSDPTGVAISPADDLYVSNENPGSFAVHGYHLGQTTPFETITSGLDGPYALGFGEKGTLFVGNGERQPGNVTAYKKNHTTPYETITNDIENPVGIGVYPPSPE